MNVAQAQEVVSRFGGHLDLDCHRTLVDAAAARVGQLNTELVALSRAMQMVEAELLALHELALWAQRAATTVELAAVTAQAAHTLTPGVAD